MERGAEEVTADDVVSQALEQAIRVESRITELRALRRALRARFRHTLERVGQILEAEMEDERTTATDRTSPESPTQGGS